MLQAVHNILLSNWGSQNYCQVIVFTDCGIGFGATSLKQTIMNLKRNKQQAQANENVLERPLQQQQQQQQLQQPPSTPSSWLPFSHLSKLSFICMGNPMDSYYKYAIQLYQELLNVSGQNGCLFIPKIQNESNNNNNSNADQQQSIAVPMSDGKKLKLLLAVNSYEKLEQQLPSLQSQLQAFRELIENMCETNYRQFEATLKCGGYFKLECPVIIWPPPLPYVNKETERSKLISRRIEICGFLNLTDIGSPMAISRHLILPTFEQNDRKLLRSDSNNSNSNANTTTATNNNTNNNDNNDGDGDGAGGGVGGGGVSNNISTNNNNNNAPGAGSFVVHQEYEKLELDIKNFYTKNDGGTSATINIEDEDGSNSQSSSLTGATMSMPTSNESIRESVCVLLHGALKVENMAALALLNDDWYGFIYSYADSKKKSNLMLNVLPPGHDGMPWLGDLRYLGTIEEAIPGENPSFPVKPNEKRSYSQNCVVWIKQAGLQSDIQKLLRHARKLPEKTQHFYKELNRIRRAALSLGFIELLEGLAHLFDREFATLAPTANPDCGLQLKHSSMELRKLHNRDLKISIVPLSTKYNQAT